MAGAPVVGGCRGKGLGYPRFSGQKRKGGGGGGVWGGELGSLVPPPMAQLCLSVELSSRILRTANPEEPKTEQPVSQSVGDVHLHNRAHGSPFPLFGGRPRPLLGSAQARRTSACQRLWIAFHCRA